jgi:hypothetical protein
VEANCKASTAPVPLALPELEQACAKAITAERHDAQAIIENRPAILVLIPVP